MQQWLMAAIQQLQHVASRFRTIIHTRWARLLFFCVTLALGFTVSAQDENDTKLPDPPADLKPLVDRSKVKFRLYETKPLDQRYVGETHFDYSVRYQFSFRQRSGYSGGDNIARGSVRFGSIIVTPKIEVRIPKRYADQAMWESDLVRHEMEHVRINADPRIALLLRKRISNIKQFEIAMQQPGHATKSQVQAFVESRVNEQVAEVTRLVQTNNDVFDRLTSHGIRPGAIEESFFLRLYTLENLQEHDFETSGVASLLRSKRYRSYAAASADSESDADPDARAESDSVQP